MQDIFYHFGGCISWYSLSLQGHLRVLNQNFEYEDSNT